MPSQVARLLSSAWCVAATRVHGTRQKLLFGWSRSAGSAWQLLNPFAHSGYGNTGPQPAVWSRDPHYAPGSAPAPRAFRDDKTLEPSRVVLGGRF